MLFLQSSFHNIVYDTDCSNCKGAYFGESEWPLNLRSDESKRFARHNHSHCPMMGEVSLER